MPKRPAYPVRDLSHPLDTNYVGVVVAADISLEKKKHPTISSLVLSKEETYFHTSHLEQVRRCRLYRHQKVNFASQTHSSYGDIGNGPGRGCRLGTCKSLGAEAVGAAQNRGGMPVDHSLYMHQAQALLRFIVE